MMYWTYHTVVPPGNPPPSKIECPYGFAGSHGGYAGGVKDIEWRRGCKAQLVAINQTQVEVHEKDLLEAGFIKVAEQVPNPQHANTHFVSLYYREREL